MTVTLHSTQTVTRTTSHHTDHCLTWKIHQLDEAKDSGNNLHCWRQWRTQISNIQ